MPALDFPASSASPFTAPNGVIYTWNAAGYWEASPTATDYLKLDATNGPVTGPLTFEGLTTHEDGVSVTGGNLTVADQIRQGTLTAAPSTDGGVIINEFIRVYGNLTDFPETSITDSQPFQILAADTAAGNKSVRLSLNASGSAYFGGTIRTGAVTAPNAGLDNDKNWLWNVNNGSSSAVRIGNSVVSASLHTTTGTSAPFASNRLGVNNGRHFDFRWGGNEVGNIRMNGAGANPTGIIFDAGGTSSTAAAFVVSSDYRLKSNIVDAPSAVNTLKQLQPRQYDLSEQTNVLGFVAHELQAVVPNAVVGTKDATEAIGTYTDPDGVVETEVTEPEAIPFGATWVQTGARPVYQGVDQTKLIPLLTKALQEALARIEQLESNTLQPLYSTLADLPDASEHHGKTAHVHSEGALYFAHAGSWVKLQNA